MKNKKQLKQLIKKRNKKQTSKKRKMTMNNYVISKGKQESFLLDRRIPVDEINKFRQIQAMIFTQKSPSPQSSRMILSTFDDKDVLLITGIVSDIVIDTKYHPNEEASDSSQNHTRILIENPYIDVAQTKFGKQRINRQLDSHIWLYTKDIQYINPQADQLTVSVGDFIAIYATVKQYRGTGDYGKITTKFGLKEIQILGSGMNVQYKENARILSDYPREGDWILKVFRDYENKDCSYLIRKMTYKESIYPSYLDRFKLNDDKKAATNLKISDS